MDDGELLQPRRETIAVLQEQLRSLGPDHYSAQYLQEPVPAGGNMFKRHWIDRYSQRPFRDRGDIILQSWDTASKTGIQNDWSVCTTWLLKKENYYLLDVFRDKIDFPGLLEEARRLINLHDPTIVLVEDTNIGTSLASVLRETCRNIKPVKASDSKQQRASVEAYKFSCGRVLLPEKARWLPDLEAELFAFPGSKHDDQVDSITFPRHHHWSFRRSADPGRRMKLSSLEQNGLRI